MSEIETAETGAQVVPETQAEDKIEAVVQEGDESQDSTTENDADKPKRKDSVQKRINELTAEKWAQKREKEELRRELDAIRQQVYQPQQTQTPTLEAFNYDVEAYQSAVYRHAQAEAVKQNQSYFEEQRQQESQMREQRHFQALLHDHEIREQKFAKITPDYNEAVEYLTKSIRFDRTVVEIIGESERSPEILYHLATNFEEAANLADMPPHKAAAHIARLEARLVSKPKPVSKAPPPAPTLKGSADAKKTLDTMSTEERIKYWNEQDRKR
jgi:hypothetical protein